MRDTFVLSAILALTLLASFACGDATYGGDLDPPEDATEEGYLSEVRYVPVDPPAEPPSDFGTARQALANIPSGFGGDLNNDTTCITGSTTKCLVPGKKDMKVHFIAGGCGSWWQARVVAGWGVVKAKVNSLGSGWSFTDSNSETAYINVRCGDAGGPANGVTEIPYLNVNEPDVSGFDPRYGMSATVYIDAAQMEGWSCFAAATEAEKRNYAENVVMHELYHAFGNDHITSTTDIMSRNAGCKDVSPAFWNSLRLLSSSAATKMQGFSRN